MKQDLEVGKIVTTHGVRGEVRIQPWCDSPDFLLGFERLFTEGRAETLQIERSRVHKNVVVCKFEGIDTVEQATRYIGKVLYMDRGDVQLPEGSFFVQDLVGLTVRDADTGECYGTLCEVSQTGANDVYHIEKEGRITLIPAIKEVVLTIDLAAGEMRIRPLEGLFE
ncbi:16S rRNA processing protein RimM [Bittarella massiliensis]|uniref:ribosome maturation factor RimM n=1 Tax=Bittarella (ex Durand et al. 2017) TaxID=1929297 RepID=UPI00163B9D79|nr:ribosome maturation factor RimM [Bittarella massiliensis (ex Durand et al. 2017)]MBC2872315.1 16S rRNA processing protein RimM [Bittarella massiliensis (ex Durand et al. 2017)]